MATGPDLSKADAAAASAAKKNRHIVTWSAKEDDVLRAQIAHHGTDNWTIIATQFKDKTARQCRRRWYNYLNTECKKGGWSREEDMLLCEAQKLLGNKWTEIAKVVSGRTDNAVKNRFSTLCKRRAKDEEPFKENDASCSNANAKRILTQTGCLTSGATGSSPPIKQMRSCIPDFKENIAPNMRSHAQEKSMQQDSRQPLAIISQDNKYSVNIVETQNLVAKTSKQQSSGGEQNCVKREGNFLKKDDPKFTTLLQQADLLCSLATKLNAENTSQSMDEAWQQLQHHLVKEGDKDVSESSTSDIASLLEELDDLIVDPYENEYDEQKLRDHNGQNDVETNTSSNSPLQTNMQVATQMVSDQKMDDCPVHKSTEDNSLCGTLLSGSMEPCPDIPESVKLGEAAENTSLQCTEYSTPVRTVLEAKGDAEMQASINLSEAAEDSGLRCIEYTSPAHNVLQAKADGEILASENFSEVVKDSRLQCIEFTSPAHTASEVKASVDTPALENCSRAAKDSTTLPCMEFTSPAHTVPTFQPYADDMPTPKITASERSFLLSVLELTSPGSRPDTSQQPSCKRALLNSL